MNSMVEQDVCAFRFMTKVEKEVCSVNKESNQVVVHPDLQSGVMEVEGFGEEGLMVNKTVGLNFVMMNFDHVTLQLRTFLGKHY